ncbi:sulfite exporter TauE/SafE family protein [Paragemmobacter straminiformis]|uniref:Probable membrane transporter protein n=1 Tax=Paragemmobacter straminiformis TaxID=2045119 RepID=A0A842I3Q3_9RHOB|nr:sulfite exporter TauE/SafE family protein [Gemmobacter straminiformis]MBC2834289.1 sulfite exporter TauE/SafE family protein [Gemmobacter straminiformis]
MEGLVFWAVAGLAAILVGLSKGGLPIVSMLGVPVLALVISPVTAAGLLLPVYVVSDMVGLWAYRREFDKRVLAILVPATTIGVVAGYLTARIVSEEWVTMLVGLIGFVFALNMILRPKLDSEPRPAQVGPGMFWGIITGFVSFVSHSGGPPYQVYTLPLGLRKMVFAGTSTILFAYVNAIKLIPYYMLGQFSAENLHVAVLLMPVAGLAVLAGVRLVKVLPEVFFFRLVTWALLAISLKLIWDASRGIGLIG